MIKVTIKGDSKYVVDGKGDSEMDQGFRVGSLLMSKEITDFVDDEILSYLESLSEHKQ